MAASGATIEQAGVLGLQQRQTETFVMGAADEDVGLIKELTDPFGGLISVQRDAGHSFKDPPIIAPASASNDVERCVRKTLRAQGTDNIGCRDEVLAWFDGSEGDQTQR